MVQCPKEILHVFDNEGKSVDRYTIVILYEDGSSYVVASSENPTHPLGVWSADEGYISASDLTEEDAHIGKEISWEDLPESVQSCVCNNFYNLTFEVDDVEVVKLDDMERNNHNLFNIMRIPLNNGNGEIYYLPYGIYRIVETNKHFIIEDNLHNGFYVKHISIIIKEKHNL